MPDYVTVKDVEIISAGRNWRGGSDYYVTAEHLADMVAAQADPLIRAPRVKLGHWSTLFAPLAGMHDPAASLDSEPAFGSVVNMRLTEGGAKIVGDLAEVPAWLAEALPSAYATRSSEWTWDHVTAGGHTYTAVLTDLALGGVWEPAVEDLKDVTREQATAALAAFLTEGPDAAVAVLNEKEPAMASKTNAAASVSVDRIVSAFEAWAWSDENTADQNTYWWWARDVRLDPNEVIACGQEGTTWRVPFTTDGEHEATFGDPVEVRETYVDVTAATAAASAAQARHEQTVLASDLPKPTRPNPAASARPEQKENPMDANVLKVLAAAHQLDPETATEEQVNAAILAANTEPTETPEEKTAREAAEAEAVAEAERIAAEEAAKKEDPAQTEAERKLAELSTELAALKAERDEEKELAVASARESEVDTWISEGRITPANRDTYLSLHKADAVSARKLAASLAPGSAAPVARHLKPTATAQNDEDALLAASRARMGHTVPQEA